MAPEHAGGTLATLEQSQLEVGPGCAAVEGVNARRTVYLLTQRETGTWGYPDRSANLLPFLPT